MTRNQEGRVILVVAGQNLSQMGTWKVPAFVGRPVAVPTFPFPELQFLPHLQASTPGAERREGRMS